MTICIFPASCQSTLLPVNWLRLASNAKQSLENIKAILEAEGLSMKNVVKTTVLMQNIGDFGAMNEVYAEYFTEECPARAAYEVAKLPKGALVEIEAIAYIK